jgi:hypothetical protein
MADVIFDFLLTVVFVCGFAAAAAIVLAAWWERK